MLQIVIFNIIYITTLRHFHDKYLSFWKKNNGMIK